MENQTQSGGTITAMAINPLNLNKIRIEEEAKKAFDRFFDWCKNRNFTSDFMLPYMYCHTNEVNHVFQHQYTRKYLNIPKSSNYSFKIYEIANVQYRQEIMDNKIRLSWKIKNYVEWITNCWYDLNADKYKDDSLESEYVHAKNFGKLILEG
jgi:hypothetical protein